MTVQTNRWSRTTNWITASAGRTQKRTERTNILGQNGFPIRRSPSPQPSPQEGEGNHRKAKALGYIGSLKSVMRLLTAFLCFLALIARGTAPCLQAQNASPKNGITPTEQKKIVPLAQNAPSKSLSSPNAQKIHPAVPVKDPPSAEVQPQEVQPQSGPSALHPNTDVLYTVSYPKENLTKYVLANGMKVLVYENHFVPLAVVYAVFKAGSIFEGKDLGSGMSHLLEHMAFKGTTHRTYADINKAVGEAGGLNNAFTDFQETGYYIQVLAPSYQKAIDILADQLQNSTFDPVEFEKERKVVIKEMQNDEQEPDYYLGAKLLLPTLYTTSPYQYPIGGSVPRIERVPRQDVVNYFHHFYVPNNMVFVVAGDVDPAKALAAVQEAFSPAVQKPFAPPYIAPEPLQGGRRFVIQEFANLKDNGKMVLSFHTVSTLNPDEYPLDVLATLLGQGKSSRLYQALVEKTQLLTEVSADHTTYPNQAGHLDIEATVLHPADLDKAEQALLNQIDHLKQQPVSPDELEKARNMTLRRFYENKQSLSDTAFDLGFNELYLGNPLYDEAYVQAIQKVTPADVQRVAQTYLTEDHLTVAELVPQGTLQALHSQATPENNSSAALAVHDQTLSNGIRLIVRENPLLPLVSATFAFPGGTRLETEKNNGLTNLLVQTLLKGTQDKSEEEIQKETETLGATLRAISDSNTMGIETSFLSSSLDSVFKLAADILLHPTFPEKELETTRQITLSTLTEDESRPLFVAMRSLRGALFPGHPYGMLNLGTRETLPSITRSMLVETHQRYFQPNKMVVTLSGRVNPEAVKALLEHLFPASSEQKATAAALNPLPALPPLTHLQRLEKKDAGFHLTGITIGFRIPGIQNPDMVPLRILHYILGGPMSSRLFNSVREKAALAYYVGTYVDPLPQTSSFLILSQIDTDKINPYLTLVQQEVEKIKAEGVTQDEVESARKQYTNFIIDSFQNNESQADVIATYALYGMPLDYQKQLIEKIKTVTPADVQRVARQYLDWDRAIIAIARPTTVEAPSGPAASGTPSPSREQLEALFKNHPELVQRLHAELNPWMEKAKAKKITPAEYYQKVNLILMKYVQEAQKALPAPAEKK